MFFSPYDTSICQVYKTQQISSILERANIASPFPSPNFGLVEKLQNIKMVTPDDDYNHIPSFTQPIQLRNGDFVFDARQYLSSRPDKNGNYVVRAHNDFTFQLIRLVINTNIQGSGITSLVSNQEYVWKVFDRWVGGAIVSKLNLRTNPEYQLMISILTAIYFIGLYYEDAKEVITTDKDVTLHKVCKWTGMKSDVVESVIDRIEPLYSIRDFASSLEEVTGSIRFKGFNLTTMITMLGGSWFGISANENAAVALEHIPTFTAMVYQSLEDRSYRKSIIGQRTDSIRDPSGKHRVVSTVKQFIRNSSR